MGLEPSNYARIRLRFRVIHPGDREPELVLRLDGVMAREFLPEAERMAEMVSETIFRKHIHYDDCSSAVEREVNGDRLWGRRSAPFSLVVVWSREPPSFLREHHSGQDDPGEAPGEAGARGDETPRGEQE